MRQVPRQAPSPPGESAPIGQTEREEDSFAPSMGSGTLYNLVARVAFLMSGYALQFGMARWLDSPVDFGRFSVLLSLITMTRTVFSTGVPQALSKFVAADPTSAQGSYRRGVALQLAAASIVWGLLVVATPALTRFLGDEQLRTSLWLASPLILLMALYQVNLGYVSGRLWFGRQAFLTLVYSISRYVLPVAFVLAGFGINGALFGLVCSQACVSLLSGVGIPREKQPSAVTTRQFLLFSWPLVVFSFGVHALMNLDLLLVQRYFPTSASVGFYSGAVNLGKAPYFAFYAFSSTALPALSRFHASGDLERFRHEVSRQVRWLILAAVPSGGLLAVSSSEALTLVYGKAYAEAAWPLSLLALSTSALSLMVVLASALTACGQPRTSMLPVLMCLPAQWLFGLLLIPGHGMLGAAVSNSLATFLGLSATLFFTWRSIGPVIGARPCMCAMVSTLVAVLAIHSLPGSVGVWVMLKIALGFAIYGVALLLTGGFTIAELSHVRRGMRGRRVSG